MNALLAVIRASLLEAWMNRAAFWLQIGIMLINDAVWIVFWQLFFSKVSVVRGWDIDGVLLMLSVITTVFGIAIGLCSNAPRLGRIVADGELDAALALPVDTLGYVLFRRASPSAVGDFLFGVGLFAFACDPTVERTIMFLICTTLAAVIFVSFLVLLGSLTLFIGGRGELADLGFEGMIMFGSYPADLFSGALKMLLFTVFPAALVATSPVRLINDFDPVAMLIFVAATIGFALVSRAVFSVGLRRYRSGANWTRA